MLAATLLEACTGQLPETRDLGERILLPLHVSATGMSSEEEDGAVSTAINSLYILVLDGDGTRGSLSGTSLIKILEARKDGAEQGKFLAELPEGWDEEAPCRLALLANVDVKKWPFQDGEYFYSITRDLHGPSRQTYSKTEPVPMFGVVNRAVPLLVKKGVPLGKVKLVRDVARIDIGVGSYDEGTRKWVLTGKDSPYLELTDVQAWAPMERDYYIPEADWWNHFSFAEDGSPLVNEASRKNLARGNAATKWEYANTEENPNTISHNGKATYCKDIIYLPETPLSGYRVFELMDRSQKTALVVGGFLHDPAHPEWENEKTWYRVDFTDDARLNSPDGEPFDLLRNHLYRISLTAVKAPGAKTPEEAWNGSVAQKNIRVEILPWEEGETLEFVQKQPPRIYMQYKNKDPHIGNDSQADRFDFLVDIGKNETFPLEFELGFSNDYDIIEVTEMENPGGITFTKNPGHETNDKVTWYRFTIPALPASESKFAVCAVSHLFDSCKQLTIAPAP